MEEQKEKEIKNIDSNGANLSKEISDEIHRHFDSFAKTIEKNLTENMLNFFNNIKEKETKEKEQEQKDASREQDKLVDF